MGILQISDKLAGVIEKEAKARGITVEDFLRSAVQRERTLAERRAIEQEQAWWDSQPLAERAKHEGEFIAIHNGRIVDFDKNETQLYVRVRGQFGNTPVLIMPAEGPREIRVFSSRFIQE